MNHLKISDSKTEFTVFGTRSLLHKSQLASICVGKSEIQKSSCIKFLSAHLNDILNFKNQVRSKDKTANYILHIICNISKFITMEVKQMHIFTLTFPHLDYANSIMVNSLKTTLKLLQTIQKSAARRMLYKAKFHNV